MKISSFCCSSWKNSSTIKRCNIVWNIYHTYTIFYELNHFLWVESLFMNWITFYELNHFLWNEFLFINWITLYELNYFLWIESLFLNWIIFNELNHFLWIELLFHELIYTMFRIITCIIFPKISWIDTVIL